MSVELTVLENITTQLSLLIVLLHLQASIVYSKPPLILAQLLKIATPLQLEVSDKFGLLQRLFLHRMNSPPPCYSLIYTNATRSGPMMNKSMNGIRAGSWASRRPQLNAETTPSARGRFTVHRSPLADDLSSSSSTTVLPLPHMSGSKSENSSPMKSRAAKTSIMSPIPSRKDIIVSTPRSSC